MAPIASSSLSAIVLSSPSAIAFKPFPKFCSKTLTPHKLSTKSSKFSLSLLVYNKLQSDGSFSIQSGPGLSTSQTKNFKLFFSAGFSALLKCHRGVQKLLNSITDVDHLFVWCTSLAVVLSVLTCNVDSANAFVVTPPRKLQTDELATVRLFQENTPSVVYITNLAVSACFTRVRNPGQVAACSYTYKVLADEHFEFIPLSYPEYRNTWLFKLMKDVFLREYMDDQRKLQNDMVYDKSDCFQFVLESRFKETFPMDNTPFSLGGFLIFK